MVHIETDDLLRALKRFKGLAKQDLLVSERTSQPDYWKTHAEARRATYAQLIELVETSGIENACVFAFDEYQKLPSVEVIPNKNPAVKGTLQALEMFFNVVGIVPEELRRSKTAHLDWAQITTTILASGFEYAVCN